MHGRPVGRPRKPESSVTQSGRPVSRPKNPESSADIQRSTGS